MLQNKNKRLLLIGLALFVLYVGWTYTRAIMVSSQFKHYQKDLYLSQVTPKTPPDFTLTDQRGNQVSLSDFKGKKVVIQPLDPKCTDSCPLISQEIIDANQQLGSSASNVVYIGFNVNENHVSVQDVKAYSDQHGLSKLSNWYFLTGTPDQLKKVWQAYGISVVPSQNGDVQHTSALFFVTTQDQIIYEGTPENNKGTMSEWSNAISFLIKNMS